MLHATCQARSKGKSIAHPTLRAAVATTKLPFINLCHPAPFPSACLRPSPTLKTSSRKFSKEPSRKLYELALYLPRKHRYTGEILGVEQAFKNEFMSEDLFDYDNRLRFFKINRMLLDFTNPDRDNNADRLRIGVSHAPLLIGGGPLLRAIISDLDPHIIFSGHWHESRIFIYPSTKVINFYENAVRHFDLKALKEQEHSYLEIMVPTCSYRMGKSKIGMGYAVLGEF